MLESVCHFIMDLMIIIVCCNFFKGFEKVRKIKFADFCRTNRKFVHRVASNQSKRSEMYAGFFSCLTSSYLLQFSSLVVIKWNLLSSESSSERLSILWARYSSKNSTSRQKFYSQQRQAKILPAQLNLLCKSWPESSKILCFFSWRPFCLCSFDQEITQNKFSGKFLWDKQFFCSK